MKMTLIDCTIVFAVSNVMLSGFFMHVPEPSPQPPICAMDKQGNLAAGSDPRCIPRISGQSQNPAQSTPAPKA